VAFECGLLYWTVVPDFINPQGLEDHEIPRPRNPKGSTWKMLMTLSVNIPMLVAIDCGK
jgi:hypothetical protein